MDFFLSGVISFPIGFCEMIKAIYQDCRNRFKMCLSSGFPLLGLSLFSPLPFAALVASLARDYNNQTCPGSPGNVLPPCLQLPI